LHDGNGHRLLLGLRDGFGSRHGRLPAGNLPALAPDAAKTVAVHAEAGVGEGLGLLAAERRATLLRRRIPRAAPHHALLARGRPAGILLRAFLVVILPIPVMAPLPDVSVQVVQSPRVRGLRPD